MQNWTNKAGRLIHYSAEPLTEVRSTPHKERLAGAFKTPGLWVSVEGENDWPSWCRDNDFGLVTGFKHATEVTLTDDCNVLHLVGAFDLDAFSEEFAISRYYGRGVSLADGLDWEAIRERWRGLIIAPYCWSRRLDDRTGWYYGWDCASGVIWDAAAVKSLTAVEPPDMAKSEAVE